MNGASQPPSTNGDDVGACPGRDRDVQRYVAGVMSEPEVAAFEAHLVGCIRCQIDVRLGIAIRGELAGQAPSVTPATRRVWVRWSAGIGALAVAAGLAAVVLLRPPDRDLPALGAVASAPSYDPIAVREGEGDPNTPFDQGMAAYAARDYSRALALLRAARAAGTDSVVTTFFIGVSSLMLDDTRTARAELRTAVAMRDSPYAAEAHYYLAKAFLRDGDRGSAMNHLRAASASRSPVTGAARALADSIEAITPR